MASIDNEMDEQPFQDYSSENIYMDIKLEETEVTYNNEPLIKVEISPSETTDCAILQEVNDLNAEKAKQIRDQQCNKMTRNFKIHEISDLLLSNHEVELNEEEHEIQHEEDMEGMSLDDESQQDDMNETTSSNNSCEEQARDFSVEVNDGTLNSSNKEPEILDEPEMNTISSDDDDRELMDRNNSFVRLNGYTMEERLQMRSKKFGVIVSTAATNEAINAEGLELNEFAKLRKSASKQKKLDMKKATGKLGYKNTLPKENKKLQWNKKEHHQNTSPDYLEDARNKLNGDSRIHALKLQERYLRFKEYL